MSYADDPQMLGAYVQNLVARVIWHAGFLHPDLLLRIITVKNVCIYTYNFPAPMAWYVGYSESKYRLRLSLAHPRDCHFAHVQ